MLLTSAIIDAVHRWLSQPRAAQAAPKGKRGRPAEPYLSFVCYEMSCVVDQRSDFPPQHTSEGGAYRSVGLKLNLSPEAVESHVRKARKLPDRDYFKWLNERESKWWHYHSLRTDSPLGRDAADYQAWRDHFERRYSLAKLHPMVFRPASNPIAVAIRNTRRALGLRNKVGERRTPATQGVLQPGGFNMPPLLAGPQCQCGHHRGAHTGRGLAGSCSACECERFIQI